MVGEVMVGAEEVVADGVEVLLAIGPHMRECNE